MPTIPCSLIAVLTATLVATGFTAVPVRAQDCLNWGDLDKKLYCDEGRDLVADTPSQRYRLRDPDTLVFSFATVEDSSVDEKSLADFLNFVSKKTGRKVQWLESNSSADLIKAMRAGQVQLAGVSPGPTVYAVNLAGYVPVAVLCRDDDTFGYEVQLITRKDSGVGSIGELKGRKVALVSALSNSGNPPGADFQIVYSGSEADSIKGLIKGDYDAALVNSDVLERAASLGRVDTNALEVLWASPSYPSTSFGFAHDLAPDLQRKLHDAFLTFDREGAGIAKAFGAKAARFCTVSYEETWQPIRILQKNDGIVYRIEDL